MKASELIFGAPAILPFTHAITKATPQRTMSAFAVAIGGEADVTKSGCDVCS